MNLTTKIKVELKLDRFDDHLFVCDLSWFDLIIRSKLNETCSNYIGMMTKVFNFDNDANVERWKNVQMKKVTLVN